MKKILFFIAVISSILIISGCTVQNKNDNSNSGEVNSSNSNSDFKASEKNITVRLETTEGSFDLEIFNETMPITAGNFEKLVREGFYDGTIFHRVIKDFMNQGGDPTGTGRGGPGYTIKDEFTDDNANTRGTISMANAGPNTGGSQFFINVFDNNFLDAKHPVFGKVTSGMDIVDKINNTETDASDKPLTDIVINKISIVE
ncbi:MAG TPA: peptidylprolyl isomerase [Candidatus Dojkabacteria bacterium]|jgi:peptidylprolyl isomerase